MGILSSVSSLAQIAVPASIDGSGEKDVSTELNKFVNSVPNNSTIVFPPNKIYRVEGILTIKNKSHLTVRGNGSTLMATTTGSEVEVPPGMPRRTWPRNREHLRIEGSDNITIIEFTIKGAHDSAGVAEKAYVKELEAQHGVNVHNSRNVVLDSLRITHVYGDCIYIGDGSGKTSSDSIVVKNCFLGFTGRQGIAITAGSVIVIQDSEFTNVRRTHIDLESNVTSASINNIIIKNNVFHSSRLNWISAAGKGNTTEVYVMNNKLTNMGAKVTVGNDKHHNFGSFYFINNHAAKPVGNPGGGAWKIINVNGFYAFGNHVPVQRKRRMYLIRDRNSTNIHAKNNVIPDGIGPIKPK